MWEAAGVAMTVVSKCGPGCGCHRPLRYKLSEAPVDYNLEAKYRHYNQTLFSGQLPEIPISWATMKNVGGKVTYQIRREAGVPKPDPRMVRFGLAKKHDGAQLVPGSLKMQISDLYKRSEIALDAILLHEMIHVYFAHTGEYGENHGPKFQDFARRISQKVGFEVPMKDSVDGLELASMDTRPVGVVILEKPNGGISFALLNVAAVKAGLNDIQNRWTYATNNGYAKKVGAFIVDTQAWTKLAAQYPVQRKFTPKTTYYILKDREAVDDLMVNGEALWTYEAPQT